MSHINTLPSSLPINILLSLVFKLNYNCKFSPVKPLNLTFYKQSSRLTTLNLESLVAIITSFKFKNIIPQTFLPYQFLPFLFLQSSLVDQFSRPKSSH
jgi:hypothetical protein